MDNPFKSEVQPKGKFQFSLEYYLTFPMAENELTLIATLPEIEEKILEINGLLKSPPRSDPNRPALLLDLAGLRTEHMILSNQTSDLDKAIVHLTEAVLLPQTQNIVSVFFHIAALLLSRFTILGQPDDVKSSLKYFRFLQIKFHSLEG